MTDGGVPWVKFDNQADNEFFAAIGRLALSWGHLDLGLGAMTHVMWSLFGREIEEEKPRALNRRIAFLRTLFPILIKEGAKPYLDLLGQVEEAAEKRHDIIHGAVVEHLEGDGKATLVRIIPKTEEIRRHTVTTTDVLTAAIEANRLSGQVFKFVMAFDEVVRELSQSRDAQNGS